MNKKKERKDHVRTTPMNPNQRTNEEGRKTHRSISHKGIQKCTSLNRNGVQVRDRPKKMTSNPKKQIVELCKFISSDTKIRTPSNGSIGNVRHDLIKGRVLIIRIDRLLYQRYTKSKGHYLRSNDILFSHYPTLHKLNVG